MQLYLGKITLTDLAQWFQISAGTLRNNKTKYLQVLNRYCRFHEEGDKRKVIVIDEIFESEFETLAGPTSFQRVKELTEQNWSYDGLDSCAHVAEKNYPTLKEEGYKISEGTNYNYTCRSRTELWGSPMKLTIGEKGSCRYEYCKQDKYGNYIPFTSQEEEIKRQVTKKYFGNLEDFTLGILDDMKNGKISKFEAGEALANLDNHGQYHAWKAELEERIGSPIYKGTRIIGRFIPAKEDFKFED